jgi:putative zinc finger/helix-turn-helix YgiT family protein
MRCHHCNNADLIETVAENYSYEESGLSNIVLKQIPVRLCPNCGMKYAGIPNMSGLHRAIALELIKKPERLAPAEIAFLRKSLGWSGADFARKMHCAPAQVSRWENGRIEMSVANELLLRSLVALGNKIEDYSVEEAAVTRTRTSEKLLLMVENKEWKKAA